MSQRVVGYPIIERDVTCRVGNALNAVLGLFMPSHRIPWILLQTSPPLVRASMDERGLGSDSVIAVMNVAAADTPLGRKVK
jgi:hypothetical protein